MAPKTITMSMADFMKEHENLLHVLRKGTPAERKKEADEQAAEVKAYTGKGFSQPVEKLLRAVSFGPPQLMGTSGDPKAMYSADYDLLEKVPFHGASTVKAFQKKVAVLSSKYCITDIKCGEVADWNLLSGEGYDQKKELAHLKRLWQEKVITDAEFKKGQDLLKEKFMPGEKMAARKELRFGVLRWTPKEVAQGYKELRTKKTFRLDDAMKSSGITKVDLLAWVKDKYVEVSNIVLWTGRSGKPYAHLPDVEQALREDVDYYKAQGNYFKVLKRLLSIAKNKREVATAERLYSVLNSHLGALSTVVSDLKTLQEFPKCVEPSKKREELDLMRDRLAKLYYPEFKGATAKLLPALESKLQEEAKKQLEGLRGGREVPPSEVEEQKEQEVPQAPEQTIEQWSDAQAQQHLDMVLSLIQNIDQQIDQLRDYLLGLGMDPNADVPEPFSSQFRQLLQDREDLLLSYEDLYAEYYGVAEQVAEN